MMVIAFDSNLLIYALNVSAPERASARRFFAGLETGDEEVVVCELVLMEVYAALRSPAIFPSPCDGPTAAELLRPFRHHPRWRRVDYPGSSDIADEWWRRAGTPGFARRHVNDARLALTLRHHGVTRFATRNVRDFPSFGFDEVWNPLVSEGQPSRGAP
jgi:predicted nucleic acid-binding protein